MRTPPKADRAPKSLLDARQLATRVIAKRRSLGLSQRQAAKEIGVSGSTLSRIEHRKHLPDSEHLLQIAQWLGLSIELAAEPGKPGKGAAHAPVLSTVEAVELQVRADRALSTADADALVESFRVVYERLKTRRAR